MSMSILVMEKGTQCVKCAAAYPVKLSAIQNPIPTSLTMTQRCMATTGTAIRPRLSMIPH